MKKGKIEYLSMADGQCGYAYGGRIYNSKQFKNLYSQGGVTSDDKSDREIMAGLAQETEAVNNMEDGGEKKKTFQKTGASGYHEDVKTSKNKIFTGVNKKKESMYSLNEDMTDANIAGGGGQRNLQPSDNTEQPQTIVNPVASASDIKRAPSPSSTQTNTPESVDGQTFTGSFSQAFGSARKSGLKTFTWNGKLFGTKLATESDQGPIASNTKREGVISNSADKEQSTLGKKITPEAEKMYAKMYSGLPSGMPDAPAPTIDPGAKYAEFTKKKGEAKKMLASNWKNSKGKGVTKTPLIGRASE